MDMNDIVRIAHLARIGLSETEREEFSRQLDSILQYARQLDEAPTQGVEPTCFMEPGHDPLRDDAVMSSLPRNVLLENAPVTHKGFFAIPKVIPQ